VQAELLAILEGQAVFLDLMQKSNRDRLLGDGPFRLPSPPLHRREPPSRSEREYLAFETVKRNSIGDVGMM
jgi:hypothetical protein